MAETKVNLKLLIEQKSQRVLFAEADKAFVDLLFSIFTLPLGTVTRLLQTQNMAGCLRSLYKIIENLSDIYIQPDQDKNMLLSPKLANISGAKVPLLLPSVEQSGTDRKIYRCGGHDNCQYVANDPRAICPSCRNQMATEQSYVDYPPKDTNASSSSEGGYVKGVITYMVMDDLEIEEKLNYNTRLCASCITASVTTRFPEGFASPASSSDEGYVKGMVIYMVMDDLEVKPMVNISFVTLLTQFNIQDVGDIQEKVVQLGINEGVQLLKASLRSKTVLTDVFLRAENLATEVSIKDEGI